MPPGPPGPPGARHVELADKRRTMSRLGQLILDLGRSRALKLVGCRRARGSGVSRRRAARARRRADSRSGRAQYRVHVEPAVHVRVATPPPAPRLVARVLDPVAGRAEPRAGAVSFSPAESSSRSAAPPPRVPPRRSPAELARTVAVDSRPSRSWTQARRRSLESMSKLRELSLPRAVGAAGADPDRLVDLLGPRPDISPRLQACCRALRWNSRSSRSCTFSSSPPRSPRRRARPTHMIGWPSTVARVAPGKSTAVRNFGATAT